MKKLQLIAKHLVSTYIPDSEKALHVSHRIINIAQQTLDPDEYLKFQSKYIDYTATQFPEINPLELQTADKRFRLANYRYPAVVQKERKGIIYFIHGYGEYVRRYAYFAEMFAKQGYDFVGIDQRGFGYSEGERGMIECEKLTIDDLLQHIEMVDAKYGGADVKKYAIGFSFGGLLTSKIASMRPELFTSVALLAPFFSFLMKEKFEKHYSTIEELSKTNPTQKLMILPMKPLPPTWTLHFVVDPACETKDISARNLYELSQAPLRLTDDMISNIKSPVLLITGKKEQVVNNEQAFEFYHKIQGRKHHVSYEDQDHMIFHDKDQVQMVSNEILSFFNQ